MPKPEVGKLIPMSIRVNDTFKRADPAGNGESAYPAEYHMRVIVEAASDAEGALCAVVSAFRVTAPLRPSNTSSGGRYRAFGVSVAFNDRTEHEAFDAAVKRVSGVRMIL